MIMISLCGRAISLYSLDIYASQRTKKMQTDTVDVSVGYADRSVCPKISIFKAMHRYCNHQLNIAQAD